MGGTCFTPPFQPQGQPSGLGPATRDMFHPALPNPGSTIRVGSRETQNPMVWYSPFAASCFMPPAVFTRSHLVREPNHAHRGPATCDLRPATCHWTERAHGSTGTRPKGELPYQFGKRHGSPSFSGKIAALFPVVLVANHTSASSFDPVRSSLIFHSGPRGLPTASCHRRLERDEAWRRMSALRS
jgi:hypothetical protein